MTFEAQIICQIQGLSQWTKYQIHPNTRFEGDRHNPIIIKNVLSALKDRYGSIRLGLFFLKLSVLNAFRWNNRKYLYHIIRVRNVIIQFTYVYAMSQSQIYFILWVTVKKVESHHTRWTYPSLGLRESFLEKYFNWALKNAQLLTSWEETRKNIASIWNSLCKSLVLDQETKETDDQHSRWEGRGQALHGFGSPCWGRGTGG